VNIEEILTRVQGYNPRADLTLIRAAYALAEEAHRGQYRQSGEEYIVHPLAVADILSELEMDAPAIAAGMLHDVVEDTGVSLNEIEKRFGPEVARLVDGVTKLNRLGFRSHQEEQVENLRKMFFAMAEDLRVIIIKLADRLHNMRTLKALPPEKQKEIARETMEIYAPLAHRLGIWRIKWELEDLAFRYLDPEKYRELAEKVAMKRQEREEYIKQVVAILRERLTALGFKAEIQGRAKHLYSIYKKMQEGRDFSQIYDLMAVRVIVDTIKDCYGVLGTVHTLWKPIPGRFKDYIAMPKANMYQSLHTSVIGPRGEPFEIQIRTWEMHWTAEFGVAAHWRYKEGNRTDKDFDQKLAWLRQVLEWQRELKDANEFMESLKIDLFDDEVFVFTPKGDVVDLPLGSTPVDFAYQIHTDVGNRCVGAKVNGKITPLNYQLKNGDIVEIITSKQAAGPSPDWLNFVKTSGARHKIKQWFKKERREENIALGREALEREVRRLGLEPHEVLREERMAELAKKLSFLTTDDLVAAVGYGGLSPQQVVSRLSEEYRKEKKEQELANLVEVKPDARLVSEFGKPSQGIRVRGISNVLIRLARCCNPVPGDPIVGFITRGRGVSVHRMDCPNVDILARERDRLIEVTWDESQASGTYPVELEIRALDRPGLLSDVAGVVAETRTNILSANVRTSRGQRSASIDLILEIKDLKQLQYIANKIERVKDVISVERVAREAVK